MDIVHYIDSLPLDLSKIQEIISLDKKLALSDAAIQRIQTCRSYLDTKTKS
ncbi:MAG: histidine ammonia-lyase, partial [Polaribacter sp.]|nr:histidine ammonia-lyase [Polaribacter sp.]